MTLKIKTPDGVKQIDTKLHKPVVFVDGQKRVLDKAWTFIGGQKKILWGKTGIIVEKINLSNVLNLITTAEYYPLKIDNSNLFITSSVGGVYNIDIQNISNPTFVSGKSLGYVRAWTDKDVSVGDEIFYGILKDTNSSTFNNVRLSGNEFYAVSPNLTVSSVVGGNLNVRLNNDWISVANKNIYVNGGSGYQINENSYCIGKLNAGTALLGCSGGVLKELTVQGANNVYDSDNINKITNLLIDGENVIISGGQPSGGVGAIECIDTNGYVRKWIYSGTAGNERMILIIGRIGNYYYVYDGPATTNSDDLRSWIRALDMNGQVVESVDFTEFETDRQFSNFGPLPITKTGETGWRCVPQVSSTGYLVMGINWVSALSGFIRIKPVGL